MSSNFSSLCYDFSVTLEYELWCYTSKCIFSFPQGMQYVLVTIFFSVVFIFCAVTFSCLPVFFNSIVLSAAYLYVLCSFFFCFSAEWWRINFILIEFIIYATDRHLRKVASRVIKITIHTKPRIQNTEHVDHVTYCILHFGQQCRLLVLWFSQSVSRCAFALANEARTWRCGQWCWPRCPVAAFARLASRC